MMRKGKYDYNKDKGIWQLKRQVHRIMDTTDIIPPQNIRYDIMAVAIVSCMTD